MNFSVGLWPLERFAFVSKLATGGFAVELPVDFDAIPVHPPIPGSRFATQGVKIGDSAATQTLPAEEPDFNLRLIEPTSMLRGVVDREAVPDLGGHLSAENVAERLAVMDIHVIHDQIDGLGLRVLQGQGHGDLANSKPDRSGVGKVK
jgi:hypothetical protein